MFTLAEPTDQPYFCHVLATKPSALGWTRLKWGKVCRGGENMPFVTLQPHPQPHSLYLSISCPLLKNTHPATSSPALKGRVGGGDWLIQYQLNVFTAAQYWGGVGRCKPGWGRNGGIGRERERERDGGTWGWPTTEHNHEALLTSSDPPSVFLSYSFFLSLPHHWTQAYCPRPCKYEYTHWQNMHAASIYTLSHTHLCHIFTYVS